MDEIFLTELCVVINVNFSVNAEDSIAGVNSPRVDLELSSIALGKQFVHVFNFRSEAGNFLQVKVFLEFVEDLLGDSGFEVNGVNLDCIRVVLSNLFDLDSSFD